MFRFLPWKFLVKHAAHRYGVLDPAMLLAKMRRFAQPSEVAEPLELLRAGIIFHARGLVNAKAIQHNLDWVWPYWVERQFNPADVSFIPRAFSFSHINLTHRNWTAVGLPQVGAYPIVDPRGLVTPLNDGWSIDFWVITEKGMRLLPSKLPDEAVRQTLALEPNLCVETAARQGDLELKLATQMQPVADDIAEVVTRVQALSAEDGWLVVAIRPYNPEGVQFIQKISYSPAKMGLRVNDEATVKFSDNADSMRMSHYAEGDVFRDLSEGYNGREISCEVGMATAAALFRLSAGVPRQIDVSVDLGRDLKMQKTPLHADVTWQQEVAGTSVLRIHHPWMQHLYDAAVKSLVLLSSDDLVPGPYTYRRFWFRDACLMLQPMIMIGLQERAARIIQSFPEKQISSGYFLSQEGEWDSNGQVLWAASLFTRLTGVRHGEKVEKALRKAVKWLDAKRLGNHRPPGTRGLLPAGFSAEHLGPNDYYYWDDFWAWGGLRDIATYWEEGGDAVAANEARALADAYSISIEASIAVIPEHRSKGAIPAAPGRRMDAGAIGSMVADYPLRLYPPDDFSIKNTADFLFSRCFHQGGFFQEMIHSGVNAYLTLDIAQTFMRSGDARYADLVRRVAELASPTGQWPEAIHPITLGGCMGDGQHGWAAAEWIMLIRNAFVREEGNTLIIGSGILPEWLDGQGEVFFGPTLTPWGAVSVRICGQLLMIEAEWREHVPFIQIQLPGYVPLPADASEKCFYLQPL